MKNPLLWMFFIFTYLHFYQNRWPEQLPSVVTSDGRGYYAYLPAFFLYNDPTFEKSMEAEKSKTNASDQHYIFHDEKGKAHNKYFPGVAIMQTPFFGLAYFTSWIFGKSMDGYSSAFQFFILVGSWIYTLLGIFFLYKLVRFYLPNSNKKIDGLILFTVLSSPIFYYLIFKPSFSHHISFFLIACFSYLITQISTKSNSLQFFRIGLILGLITAVRPTNVLVVLLIPFLVGGKIVFLELLKEIFVNSKLKLFGVVFGFSVVVLLLMLIWKWQSGHWLVWSYSGEGFNWFHPKIWQVLMSFRVGLFLHSPIFLLSFLSSYYLFQRDKFLFFVWMIYFFVNAYVISAWWCWDYESAFGNRPFTDHIVPLLLPLLYFLSSKWIRKKLLFPLLFCTALLGTYRFYQFYNGDNLNQRFTKESYFKSLQFWKKYPDYRFNFTLSPELFGEKISEKSLLYFPETKEILPEMEFPLGGESTLELPRTSERFYYIVELDKKISDDFLDGVHLVVDASNADFSKRFYNSTDLFNDRYEGKTDWKHLRFEGNIPDNLQQFDRVKIYLWNRKRKHLWVKNVKITLSKYLAE